MTSKVILSDILAVELLRSEIDAGFVTERHHPLYDQLRILNYTPEAQYSKRWNDVTRMTRGLIYDVRTGEVLARPFPKIHNWDEPEAPAVAWDQILYHWDNKWDGSLGIVYRSPDGGLAVATRGSFDSEQARHATEWLMDSLDAIDEYEWATNNLALGYTPLFEIIYPENRIVLDYGDMDKMVPLGTIHMETGAFIPPTSNHSRKFSELQLDLSRANSEGWIAWVTPYKAVKIKQADYVELHRIVSSLNEKEVWRQKKAGTFESFLVALPDEFYTWATEVGDFLQSQYDAAVVVAKTAAEEAQKVSEVRKEQALYVTRTFPKDMWGDIFGTLDGKDISEGIWRRLEPKGAHLARTTEEE